MATNTDTIGKVASNAGLPKVENVPAESMDFKQKILPRPWVKREPYILSRMAQAEQVLHLGCSDAPYTRTKLDSGELLHLHMLKKQPQVIGFDLDPRGTHMLQRACPDGTFICGNAENLGEHFPENSFDLIVAGEIVEHLSNPGHFFAACAKVLRPEGVLLVTIPNTFGIRRFIHSFFGVENYHPDHTFYFSENTIGTLAARSGLSIFRSRYYASEPGASTWKNILYTAIEIVPAYIFGDHFLDGLVIELKKQL